MERVLIVEDCPEMCVLLRGLLSGLTIETATAGSLQDAKSMIAESNYALFVFDLHLPDGDSFFVSFAIVHEEGWAKELFDVKATWNCIEYTTLNKNGALFVYEVDNERVDHDVKFDYPLARFVLEALKHKFHQSPCDCLEPKNESTKTVHLTSHGPKGSQFPFAE